jgi:hypothetical protein
MRVEIKHLDIVSVMKVCFVVYGIIGLVAGLIVLLVTLASSSLIGYGEGWGPGRLSGLVRAGFGVIMVPLIAVMYGCIGAVGGLIVAAVYNVICRIIGGIKVTLAGEGLGPGTDNPSNGREVRL